MDLLFPHHECEIAQNVAGYGKPSVRYWMHNNMITINGQKMGRSLGNFITLDQLFSGDHPLLEQAYGPMTIRFFSLQAHDRSTLDFSNEALQAAEKGMERLMKGLEVLEKVNPGKQSSFDVEKLDQDCHEALLDDLNTARLIGHLLGAVSNINKLAEEKESLTNDDLEKLLKLYRNMAFDVLGLESADRSEEKGELSSGLMDLILDLRKNAKAAKDYGTADSIREGLQQMGIILKDHKDGTDWEVN